MSFDLTGTSDKAGGYMKTYLDATAASGAVLLPAMKALAKGVLRALSEDETGFNQPPGDAGTVSGGLVGSFVSGAGVLVSGTSAANATSGTISFGGQTFNTSVVVLIQGVNTEKIVLVSNSSTGFNWKTSDASTFNGNINWLALGTP